MAVKEGHKEIVEFLVKRKADVNSKDTKGVSTYMTILIGSFDRKRFFGVISGNLHILCTKLYFSV